MLVSVLLLSFLIGWSSSSRESYRLLLSTVQPNSSNHPVTTSVFFADFSSFLENIIMSSVPLLIAGDFNIHLDVSGNVHSVCLKELLESMGLQQYVNVPTHESGHTLDLIITR